MRRPLWFFILLIAAINFFIPSKTFCANEAQDYKISVWESSGNGLKLRFQLENYRLAEEVVEGVNYNRILLSGSGEALSPGQPVLPSLSRIIVIPEGCTAVLSILSAETEKLELEKPLIRWQAEDQEFRTPVAEPRRFPEQRAALSPLVSAGGIRLTAVDIFPFSFDADTRQVEVIKEVEVEISFIPQTKGQSARKISSTSRKWLSGCDALLNPEILSSRDEDFTFGGYIYVLPDDSYEEVIQPLIEWRTQTGYQVTAAHFDEIGTTAEELRDYLQDAYNNWDTPPEYVTLVGDVDGPLAIPCFEYELAGSDGEPSDHYYSLLEGDDYFADIQIGRLSVRSAEELEAVVDKIIAYEKNPYQSGDRWFDRGLLIADSSALASLSVMQWTEDVLEENGYSSVEAVNYFVNLPTVSVINSLNSGVGILNFRGWGDWGGFSAGDIHNLRNLYKTPFILGCASETNDFEAEESLGEAWLRAGTADSPLGGIACVGPTAEDTWSKWDGAIDQGMIWGLYGENLYRAAPMLNRGKFELWLNFPLNRGPGNTFNSVECYYHVYSLLGDAGTPIWSGLPFAISSHHAASAPLGRNYLEVYASDRLGRLEGAYAALSMDNELLRGGFTNRDGFVNLIFETEATGSMTLTITAQNRKPYQGQIEIFEAQGYIGYNSVVIDDDSLGSSLGNGDGEVNPGETVELTVALENFGGATITDVTAEITSENPDITIIIGEADYGDFTGSSIVSNEEPFVVQVGYSATEEEEALFEILAEDGAGHSFSSQFTLTVKAPEIEITDFAFPQLQPDSLIMPGQESDFVIYVRNAGGGDWGELTCYAHCEFEGVNLSDTVGIFPPCNPGEIVSNSAQPFFIAADITVFPGLEIPLTLRFFDGYGWEQTRECVLPIGECCPFDPVAPMDGYGYFCFDNSDVAYANAPQYEWREIDPNQGGEGIEIELSDLIANRGDSEIIDFPAGFNFRHYGAEYDRLTVCSNGWMAAGENDYWEFRNKAIPSAGLPPGLIAPFWDDLMILEGSGVYYFYDEEDDVFIVEWSRTKNAINSAMETFEVLLWDADQYPTPTGDSPVTFNYLTVNDVDYLNNYSTVGIADGEGDAGLQYVYAGLYTPGADTLESQRCLFFTTDSGGRVSPPLLEYEPASFSFSLAGGETAVDSLRISNLGEANLQYTLEVSLWEGEGSGGPDAYGYIWVDSDDPGGNPFNWVDISAIGVEINFPHNDSTSANLPFGFDFPFYGNNFNSIILSANGWCSFTSHSNAYNNTNLPSYSAPENLVSALWDDLDPLAGNCHVLIWSNETDSVVVSYINVERWGSSFGRYTYQVILEAEGRITFQYQDVEGIINSLTVGIQNAAKTIGLPICFNQTYLHDGLRIDIQKPWFRLENTSGTVAGGESEYIGVLAEAGSLLPGNYNCEIILTSNDPIHLYQTIPVNLEVTGDYEAVSGLVVRCQDSGMIIEWEPAAKALYYIVFRSEMPVFSISDLNPTAVTSSTFYLAESSPAGKPYFYKVFAVIE